MFTRIEKLLTWTLLLIISCVYSTDKFLFPQLPTSIYREISDYLPPEVWTPLFTKLSSKTLLRCTSVCKSFHTLITHPDFIKSHFGVQKPQGLFLVRSYTKRGVEVYSLHYDNDKLTKYASTAVPYPHVYPQHYRIVGSCRGILCLSDEHLLSEDDIDIVFLWNPAIGKWLDLRTPESNNSRDHYSFNRGLIGFGFDAKSNDYKVVRIAAHHDTQWPAEVYVYSLSSGTWRNVSIMGLKLEHVIHPYTPQAYINGAVHWLVSDKSTKRNLILSFNMSSELFQVMEVPDTVSCISPYMFHRKVSLAVIEGSLCLIERNGSHYSDLFANRLCLIWLMKEYGVSSSWTKKVDIEFDRPVLRLLGCRMNGEFIFEGVGSLHSYDPEVMRARDCVVDNKISPLVSVTRNRDSLETCEVYLEDYTDSLVLLGTQTQLDKEEPESEEEKDEVNLRNLKGKIKKTIGSLLKRYIRGRKPRKHRDMVS